MSLLEAATPYIVGAGSVILTVNGWLLLQTIGHGRDIVELKTAFRFYLERTGMDGAKILAGSSNPTPPEMQELLQKYPDALKNGERLKLKEWLQNVIDNHEIAKGERSIALQLLAAMETLATATFAKEQRR